MTNEERLTLNIYLEGLYQAMQIGDIVYEPKHSSELYNLINKLLKENQELKKQFNEKIILVMKLKEELEDKRKEYQEVYKDVRIEIKDYKNQQKEFIEYLEEKLNMCDGFLDTIKSDLEEISYAGRIAGKTYIATQIMKNETSKKNYEEVLSKYKEIIGGDNK